MGSDLPPMKSKAPTFVVWAMKDPTSGNLDRIEIVKGWTKNGQSFEKIYDAVWSGDRKPDKWTGRIPAIKSTVDIDNATYTNNVGSVGAEDGVDRPRLRSQPARLLLCACAGDSHAALVHPPGEKAEHRAAGCGAGNRAGAGLGLADLVHPERRGAQGGAAGDDGRGSDAEGRNRPRRGAAQETACRKGRLGAQQRHGWPKKVVCSAITKA